MPNAVDPLGGWTDTGVVFIETNGIVRGVWQKPASGSYTLYHTVRGTTRRSRSFCRAARGSTLL